MFGSHTITPLPARWEQYYRMSRNLPQVPTALWTPVTGLGQGNQVAAGRFQLHEVKEVVLHSVPGYVIEVTGSHLFKEAKGTPELGVQ